MKDTCLRAVMIIPKQEKTPAAPYIVQSPLDFNNMSIIVDCLISFLLEFKPSQIKWTDRNWVISGTPINKKKASRTT